MAHSATTSDSRQTRPFRLDDPRYNMNTYFGRFRHFLKVFNPM